MPKQSKRGRWKRHETRKNVELRALIAAPSVQLWEWQQDLKWINRLPWRLRCIFFLRNIPGVMPRGALGSRDDLDRVVET